MKEHKKLSTLNIYFVQCKKDNYKLSKKMQKKVVGSDRTIMHTNSYILL